MRRLLPFLLALAVVSLLGDAQARRLAEPIVGTWTLGGLTIEFTGSGGSYAGVVVAATTSGSGCPHPVGERIFTARGSGTRYAGTELGFKAQPGGDLCAGQRVAWPTTFDIARSGDQYVMTYTVDLDGSSVSGTMTRKAAPAPATAKVSFSLSQEGLPLDPVPRGLRRSQTTGSGSAVFRLEGDEPQSPGKATGTLVHVDEQTVGGKRVKRRLTVRVAGASYQSAPAVGSRPATRVLRVTGTVTASSDPACKGKAAVFLLRDAGTRDGLNVLVESCHPGEQFEVSPRNRLKVRVGEPAPA